jgi:hypothetical protein
MFHMNAPRSTDDDDDVVDSSALVMVKMHAARTDLVATFVCSSIGLVNHAAPAQPPTSTAAPSHTR